MRIMVVGDGKVGHTLAENLAREGHDVTIVDRSDNVLQKSMDTLDVMCVKGNGANIRTLMEADVGRADIVLAATATDEINMICCLAAKQLGAKYAIARIRDPEYNESITLLQKVLGIDMAINPERATALEISRLLRYPFADNIESFARGRVEMVEFRAQEGDAVTGCPIRDLGKKLRSLPQVLYCAVERGGEVIIPNGDFVIEPGDEVYVASDMVTITAFFNYLGKNKLSVRSVMLLGGGRISYYLAKMIVPMGIKVTIIEIKPEKARLLSEQLPGVNIVCGDGTDQDLLNQEGLFQSDAFVALCDRDEENMMTGLYAMAHGVGKVIVKNNRVNYTDIIKTMGLGSIVSPKLITCDTILRYVRARADGQGTAVEKIYRIMDGKAEALEFIAEPGAPYVDVPLRKLSVRENALVAVIFREGKVIVPFGNDHIEAGDSVVIVARENGIASLNQVLSPREDRA